MSKRRKKKSGSQRKKLSLSQRSLLPTRKRKLRVFLQIKEAKRVLSLERGGILQMRKMSPIAMKRLIRGNLKTGKRQLKRMRKRRRVKTTTI